MPAMEMDTGLFLPQTNILSLQTRTDTHPSQFQFCTLRNTSLNLREKLGHRNRSPSGASSYGSRSSIFAHHVESITFPVNRLTSRILINSNSFHDLVELNPELTYVLVNVYNVFNGKMGQEEHIQCIRIKTVVKYYPGTVHFKSAL